MINLIKNALAYSHVRVDCVSCSLSLLFNPVLLLLCAVVDFQIIIIINQPGFLLSTSIQRMPRGPWSQKES